MPEMDQNEGDLATFYNTTYLSMDKFAGGKVKSFLLRYGILLLVLTYYEKKCSNDRG